MLLPAACTTEEDFGGGTVPPGDGFTIEAVCQNMLPQQVVTRSAIAKDDKEKRINQLYLFFFDENGDYLESSNTKVFSRIWLRRRIRPMSAFLRTCLKIRHSQKKLPSTLWPT